MKIRFKQRGVLEIDDARIIYRNFRGEASKFNRAGDKNFAVVIDDQEHADILIDDGWNVKIKPPREDGDTPFMTLPVKVKFNKNGPAVYLETNGIRNKLDEESVACLDDIDIESVSLDIRPYDWVIQEGTPHEKKGRSAYLQAILVVQKINRFAASYNEDDRF